MMTKPGQMVERINWLNFEDIREILLDENAESREVTVYPVLTLNVKGINLTCVLDTGSKVSALNEAVYLKCTEVGSWPVLPLQGTKVKGALIGKSVEVRRQTEIEFQCQGHYFMTNFFVVPSLAVDAILGVDFLVAHQAILNIGCGEVRLKCRDSVINLKFDECATRDGASEIYVRLLQNSEMSFKSEIGMTNGSSSIILYRVNEDENEVIREIQERISLVEDAPTSVKDELLEILQKHSTVFSETPGTIKGFLYRFQVREHRKFFVRPYPIPLIYKEQVEKELDRMLAEGVIEPAVSSYNSPLLVVPKRDKSIRLVLDSRQINTIIEPETDRPQTLDELLQKFNGVKVMSSIDLRASYWQIELHPSCRQYTAFLCYGHCYQFRKLPFGLNVSSAAFIRGFNSILPAELRKRITTYVDDVLIAEGSWENHNQVLGQLLNIFSQSGVTVNLKKSEFGRKQIRFLGHLITAEGIKPDPEKIAAIRDFPIPTTKKQVRAYLGLTNFYKRFVRIDTLATPNLCALTSKNRVWIWDTKAQEEFEGLKRALLSAPLLAHPDLNKDFCLGTDSSKTGIAAELFQEIEENGQICRKTIGFASRVLNKSERNYAVTELEAMAIVFGFVRFRGYLYGRTTKVYTDHRALQFLMSAKLTHGRLARWALYLQEFRFTIVHIPGSENVVADALSRSPVGLKQGTNDEINENSYSLLYLQGVAFENFVTNSLTNIAQEQDKDPILKDVKAKWRDNTKPSIRQYYLVKKQILFRRSDPGKSNWVVCIPDELVNKLIWYTHLSYAHFGARKCYKKLRDTCYFISMEKRIRKVLATCKACQKAKPPTVSHQAPLFPIIPSRLKELAAVDLFGPLPRTASGFSYIFVAVELTSKFVSMTPLRRATSTSVSRAFVKDFLGQVGHVDKVIADNGPQFRSLVWKRTLQQRRIRPIFISVYHPASNPCERVMKELGKLCRLYCFRNHRVWDKYIQGFQNVINELPNDSTSMSPRLVLKNEHPEDKIRETVPLNPQSRLRHREVINLAIENIKKAAERRRKHDKVKRAVRRFVVGQKVLVRSRRLSNKQKSLTYKFFPIFVGPYRIRRIAHQNTVELETIRSKIPRGIHHVSSLRVYRE